MKSLIVFFILLFTMAAHAVNLQEGSYSGADAKRQGFSLHLQSYPGREGSFLGILTNGSVARLYLLDQFSTGKYGMLSLRALDNYVIGATSTTPIMALTVTADSLVITPNHAQVDITFNTSISIKQSSKKPLYWRELVAGNYGSKKMVVSAIDGNNEATVASRIEGFSGDYVLRESRPKLYVLLESQLNPTGVKLSKDVKNIVFFLGSDLVIMNSADGKLTKL
jgi:hypothetical protein